MAATTRMGLFQLQLRIQVLGHTRHILSAQQSHVADGSCIRPCRQSTFPSVWKGLLDSTEPKPVCIRMRQTLEGGREEA